MRKSMRLFKQNNTMETCICCCVLMILDYYRLLGGYNYPTRQMETSMYRNWGSRLDQRDEFAGMQRRYVAGTPLSAAAACLSEYPLDVRIVHSEIGMLNNDSHYYPDELFPSLKEQYISYLREYKDSLTNETGVQIDCGILANELDDKNLLIPMLIVAGMDGPTLHGVVIDRYREQDGKRFFHICDPAGGRYELSGEELELRIHTPLGKSYIAVKEVEPAGETGSFERMGEFGEYQCPAPGNRWIGKETV